jgi:hypothetical protein
MPFSCVCAEALRSLRSLPQRSASTGTQPNAATILFMADLSLSS